MSRVYKWGLSLILNNSLVAPYFLFSCFVAVVVVVWGLFVFAGSFLSVLQIKSLSILTRKRHFIEFLTNVLSRTCWTQGTHPAIIFTDWEAQTRHCSTTRGSCGCTLPDMLDSRHHRRPSSPYCSLIVDGWLGHVPSRHFGFADCRWVSWTGPKSTFFTR